MNKNNNKSEAFNMFHCVRECVQHEHTHTPGHNRTFALAAIADIWDAINILFSQFYKNMFYTPSSRRQPCMIMHNIYIYIQTSTHHPPFMYSHLHRLILARDLAATLVVTRPNTDHISWEIEQRQRTHVRSITRSSDCSIRTSYSTFVHMCEYL